jgi:hypothetical protein
VWFWKGKPILTADKMFIHSKQQWTEIQESRWHMIWLSYFANISIYEGEQICAGLKQHLDWLQMYSNYLMILSAIWCSWICLSESDSK